jgi:hypothetical protein
VNWQQQCHKSHFCAKRICQRAIGKTTRSDTIQTV